MQNDSNTAQRPEGATRVSLLQEFTKTNAQQINVDVEGAQASADNDKIKSVDLTKFLDASLVKSAQDRKLGG